MVPYSPYLLPNCPLNLLIFFQKGPTQNRGFTKYLFIILLLIHHQHLKYHICDLAIIKSDKAWKCKHNENFDLPLELLVFPETVLAL